MFLIMDVGAGSLDVATFIIHNQDGDDIFNILSADVNKLGAYILHKKRTGALKSCFENEFARKFDICDGVTPLPKLKAYECDFLPNQDAILCDVDESFKIECKRFVGSVIRNTKNAKNPHASEWKQGMQFFLCGGGSKIELYDRVISRLSHALRSGCGFPGFDRVNLPKPENLEAPDFPLDEYHRISVSYGLSFSSLDFGQIYTPCDNPDLPPSGNATGVKIGFDYTLNYEAYK